MIESEIDHQIHKGDDLRRHLRRQQLSLTLVVLALIAGPIYVRWWLEQQYPSISTISISEVEIVGERELCPGDNLTIRFAFHAEGAGLLIRDSTTWRTTPPETVVFSTQRRFILSGPIDQQLTEVWNVPATYISADTGLAETLTPGVYERLISISSPSRDNVIAIASAPFTVLDDCP